MVLQEYIDVYRMYSNPIASNIKNNDHWDPTQKLLHPRMQRQEQSGEKF